MLGLCQLFSAAFVAFATLSRGAPLTELGGGHFVEKRHRDHGWRCVYDGPTHIGVDSSLNLPNVLASICLQINYAHEGCDGFRNYNQPSKQDACPGSRWDDALSVCVEVNSNGEEHQNNKHHVKSKARKDHGRKKSKHTQPEADEDVPVSVASFSGNDIDEADEESRPHQYNQNGGSAKKKHRPTKNLSQKKPKKAKTCQDSEYFSSTADRCLDRGYFTQPNQDSACARGTYDTLLNLCLDLNLLGTDKPLISAVATVNGDNDHPTHAHVASKNPEPKCEANKRYSTAISACVDLDLLTTPVDGKKCGHGQKFDLLLGLCVDVTANVLGLVDAAANIQL